MSGLIRCSNFALKEEKLCKHFFVKWLVNSLKNNGEVAPHCYQWLCEGVELMGELSRSALYISIMF